MAKVTRTSYGPDDPVFKSGPQVFVPASRPSTESSPPATGGTPPSKEEKHAMPKTTGSPKLRLVRQEGRDPYDETAPETPMTPEQLAVAVRLSQSAPDPDEQQEQSMMDEMARLYKARLSKKDQSTS